MLDSSASNNQSVNRVNPPQAPVAVPGAGGEIVRPTTSSLELGVLLLVSGIAGIVLPGPVGTPLVILACVMIWPRTFKPVNMLFARCFPRTHHFGSLQSARFLSDLERRYPRP